MLTPKPYLSWSQLDLVERSEERYIEQYIGGQKSRINRAMAYGKTMAEGLENDEMTGDPVLDMVMMNLPKFENRDKQFIAELKDGKEIIPILAKPDTHKTDMTAFKEYKTANERWTRKRAQESGQVKFYATAMFLITKKIPFDIELIDVATRQIIDDETGQVKGIEATGEFFRHPVQVNMTDILNMIVRMKKGWRKIGQLYEATLL